jgi:hypothetical protein
MNNLQSNERHLADKLRDVPAPDVDRSWEQMKKLLDRDMPEGAGAGWSGNRKWWWMGITAGVVMLSVWLTQQLSQSRNENLVNKETINNTAPAQGSSSETVAAANSTQSQQSDIKNQPVPDKNIQPTASSAPENKNSVVHQRDISKSGSGVTGNQNGINNPGRKNPGTKSGNNATDVATTDAGLTSTGKNSSAIPGISNNSTTPVQKNISQPQDKPGVVSAAATGNDITVSNVPSSTTMDAAEENIAVKYAKDAVLEKEALAGPAAFFNTAVNSGDAYAIHKKTDRESRRQLRQQYMKDDNRKVSRSNMRGNFGEKEHDITFAAGLTVPQSFAIGGQQSSAYNANARPGRLPDYLPAPFFQYHINPRLFLQTELHFQSPQYTQRLLLAQTAMGSTPVPTLQNSVYLEKLYYFNVPFNLYYSPMRNLYVGGGLQYSSLLSGVATYEQRTTTGPTPTYSSVTRQFKDDSLAAKFAPSEWRYQFDANYYFKRFTLGLRYNQAMRDFINLKVNNTLPPTQDRNQSFLLYLRFNIWEERKKTND